MSVVSQLYQLQLVDTECEQTRDRLDEVTQRLGLADDVVRARAAVAESEEKQHQSRMHLKALELEIGTVSAKLKSNQERLYGGRVRNPKELAGLDEEAKALRRRRSELEDQELELMIGVDDQEAELVERQARLRQIESNWQEEQAAVMGEKEQLEHRLAELLESRDDMRARIPAAQLAVYDDLRERLGVTAVTLLKRGVCQLCGVDVPTGVAQAVERGGSLHYCPVCSRLLYGGG